MSIDTLHIKLSTFLPHTLCGLRQSFCPSGTLRENASIQILYLKNIYNGTICLCLYFIKNAVLHKAYPKDIRFFYANKKFLYKLKYYHYSLI